MKSKNRHYAVLTYDKKTLSFFSGIIFLLLAIITTNHAQKTEYILKGRVIDENGQPISGAKVRVSPIKYIMEEKGLTDEGGVFSLRKSAKKGDIFYLYVSEHSKYTKYEWTMIDPPFFYVNVKNKRFFGKPIKFGDEKVIDVGDVNVQFWFGTVYMKFQINGRNLTENEWKFVWCRLKDEKGRLLWEQSIGPRVEDNQVDLQKSILKLSLPEGNWKLEFQKYDYDKNKIYPKIIGQTRYFTIDKDKYPETIDVLTQCSKCF